MNAGHVCERMVEARGAGDAIVRVDNDCASSAADVAARFGLSTLPAVYHEVTRQEARAVLVAVLQWDMAYRCSMMSPHAAATLADAFIGLFQLATARFFTNGEYGQPRGRDGHGPAWSPATEATFDTGILVLDTGRIGCAWFMDED